MLKALRAIWEARKGFRWSLYFVKNDELLYALHEHAVMVLLGYVIAQFERGRAIQPGWRIFINFNRDHSAIELEEKYFPEVEGGYQSDHERERTPSQELIGKISAVDPGWMVPGGQPVFVDARTRKHLPLGPSYEAVFRTPEQRFDDISRMLDSTSSREINLETVIHTVFR